MTSPKFNLFFIFFSRKLYRTCHANCLCEMLNPVFWEKIKKEKKNQYLCHLLKILHRELSIKKKSLVFNFLFSEVVRTRLREEGSRYRSFFQTLILVGKEEGARGLYRGLPTQLVRQIPNTAVMMGTYELVVKLHHRWKKDYT